MMDVIYTKWLQSSDPRGIPGTLDPRDAGSQGLGIPGTQVPRDPGSQRNLRDPTKLQSKDALSWTVVVNWLQSYVLCFAQEKEKRKEYYL